MESPSLFLPGAVGTNAVYKLIVCGAGGACCSSATVPCNAKFMQVAQGFQLEWHARSDRKEHHRLQ